MKNSYARCAGSEGSNSSRGRTSVKVVLEAAEHGGDRAASGHSNRNKHAGHCSPVLDSGIKAGELPFPKASRLPLSTK